MSKDSESYNQQYIGAMNKQMFLKVISHVDLSKSWNEQILMNRNTHTHPSLMFLNIIGTDSVVLTNFDISGLFCVSNSFFVFTVTK